MGLKTRKALLHGAFSYLTRVIDSLKNDSPNIRYRIQIGPECYSDTRSTHSLTLIDFLFVLLQAFNSRPRDSVETTIYTDGGSKDLTHILYNE